MKVADLALPRERVELTTALPVEEVKRRLAAATAGWTGAHHGRAVPPPPWSAGARFRACEGSESRWLALPVVVAGGVEPCGAGARVTAVLRPHGIGALPYAVLALFLAGPAFARGVPVFGVLWLVLIAATATFNLTARVAERAPALRALLAGACDGPSPGAAPGRGPA